MNLDSVRKIRATLALILGAGLPFLASAQDNTSSTSGDTNPVKMEKFVVTGSNIPTASDSLAVPVTVIGPKDIVNTGVTTSVLDVLRKAMPAFSGGGNIGIENANISSNSTYGGSMIALHNLPTLVLLNGRRVAFDPAASEGGYEYVDLNLIPLAAIERIDVLADGASAIYGSDAIGGVVNIILKSDYNGWEFGGHYGVSSNTGHYTERSAYLAGGVSNGDTSITVSAEYTKNDPIFQYQRPFSNPVYGTTYYPGIIDVFNFSDYSDQRYKLKDGLNAPPGGGMYSIDQLVAMGIYTPVTGSQALHGFNLANYVTLLTNMKRRSVAVNITHKIYGDHLSAFGDFLYANTYTQSQLNAQPLYPSTSDPYTDPFWFGASPPPAGNMVLPVATASNPFSQAWLDQGSPADYSAGYVVTAHNRFYTYPRIFQNDGTMLRAVGGLRGKINDNYSWETAATLNRYQLNYTNPNLADTVNLNEAIANGALNPFAMTQTSGVLPGNILGTAFANMVSTLNIFDAKLTGTPFDLPAGKLGFAVGASYSREALQAQPDVNSIPDANGNIGWAGATSLQPFNVHRTVTAFYGELSVPVVGPNQNIPGVHSLNMDLAGRFEDYSDAGTSSVPKVSMRYQPIDDQLTLRATVGKSFSAPSLYALFGPITTGFSNPLTFNNYGGGSTQQVQFQSQSGANRSLKPSTATTWTAGFVYSPKQLKGLSVTFDYYQTLQKGLVGSWDQTVVAQSVEMLGPNSPYASAVHFGSPSGPGVTAPGQLSSNPPSHIYLVTPNINLAAQAVKGFDTTVEYKFDTPSFGTVDFTSTATIYNSFRAQALPTEPYYQYAGHATGYGSISQGTLPRWRTYTTLKWDYHHFNFLVAQTYIPSVTDIGAGGSAASAPTKVAAYQAYDFSLGYDFAKANINPWLDRLTVQVGINNAFNKMPPLAPSAFPDSNVDIGTYNPIGRLFFTNISYKF